MVLITSGGTKSALTILGPDPVFNTVTTEIVECGLAPMQVSVLYLYKERRKLGQPDISPWLSTWEDKQVAIGSTEGIAEVSSRCG